MLADCLDYGQHAQSGLGHLELDSNETALGARDVLRNQSFMRMACLSSTHPLGKMYDHPLDAPPCLSLRYCAASGLLLSRSLCVYRHVSVSISVSIPSIGICYKLTRLHAVTHCVCAVTHYAGFNLYANNINTNICLHLAMLA